jgi:hypothetical protein
MDVLASWTPGQMELVIIMLVFFLSSVVIGSLPVIAFWKICTKAGFAGPLALLMLVPIANLILLFYIAFTKWPALKKNDGS